MFAVAIAAECGVQNIETDYSLMQEQVWWSEWIVRLLQYMCIMINYNYMDQYLKCKRKQQVYQQVWAC